MISQPLPPELYHAKHHQGEPFETCWRCGRGRAICRSKIRFDSWQEAQAWVDEKNETERYANPVTRYRCRWCLGWHMHRPKKNYGRKRCERARRKWLVAQRVGAS